MAGASQQSMAPPGAGVHLLDVDEHNEEEYGRVFCRYFEYLNLEQFEQLMLQAHERHVYAVYVDAVMLLNHNAKVGHLLLAHPARMITIAERSAVRTQEALLRKINAMRASQGGNGNAPASQVSAASHAAGVHDTFDIEEDMYTVKRNVKVRVMNLPLTDDFYKKSIASLGTEDVGQLLCVKGIVIREGSVKMFEAVKEYACDRCVDLPVGRRQIDALSPVHGSGVVQRPPKCEGCHRAMTLVPTLQSHTSSRLRDYQEIKLQDIVTNLEAGTIPRSITVVLEDDLAESCRAGDDLVVVGALTQRWNREPKAEQRSVIELVLSANHIRVTNENKAASMIAPEEEEAFEEFWRVQRSEGARMRARNAIVRSVCPQVYGLHRVKLGMLLVLVGGYSIDGDAEGNRTRGECHMLLVGDPGTAKSQFLQFAASMSSRSVCTTGIGSTAAGLTVSAYKESGEWVLDAGALVIADGGVCCIDEFSTIPEQKHIAIHEAMEQQTISIAKAGLVTTLNTRCSIVAACNPKKDQSLHDGETSIGIATPLLSRFDLIMVMLDNHDEAWDARLARFVLARAEAPPYDPDDARPAHAGAPLIENGPYAPQASQQQGKRQISAEVLVDVGATGTWDTETLRTYIEYVRSRKRAGIPPPPMTPVASVVLQRYYNLAREQRSSMNKARRTVRMLESLIRLSQAHALLLCRAEVTLTDAIVAVALHDLTNEQAYSRGDGGDAPLRADAPEDPYTDYLETQEKMLEKLGLAQDPLFQNVPRWAPPAAPTATGLAADARYAYVASQMTQTQEPTDSMAALFASRGRRAMQQPPWRTPAGGAAGDTPACPTTRGARRAADFDVSTDEPPTKRVKVEPLGDERSTHPPHPQHGIPTGRGPGDNELVLTPAGGRPSWSQSVNVNAVHPGNPAFSRAPGTAGRPPPPQPQPQPPSFAVHPPPALPVPSQGVSVPPSQPSQASVAPTPTPSQPAGMGRGGGGAVAATPVTPAPAQLQTPAAVTSQAVGSSQPAASRPTPSAKDKEADMRTPSQSGPSINMELGSGMVCVTPDVREEDDEPRGDGAGAAAWDDFGLDLNLDDDVGFGDVSPAPAAGAATQQTQRREGGDDDGDGGGGGGDGVGPRTPPPDPRSLPPPSSGRWSSAGLDTNATHPSRDGGACEPTYGSGVDMGDRGAAGGSVFDGADLEIAGMSQASQLSQPIAAMASLGCASVSASYPPRSPDAGTPGGVKPALRRARLGNANRMARSISRMRMAKDKDEKE